MGTPGTYLLIDAYAKIANVSIIANKEHNDPFRIVHSPPKSLKLHEILFNSKDYLESILQIATSFEPDIVNIASHPGWTDIVDYLKENYPTPIYVFDIKSPLLSPLNSEKSREIGEKGRTSAKSIDLVVTRSRGDVFTWIPQCVKPVLVYPLGVRLSDYSPRSPERGFSRCTRFVYSGAIAPLRKLDTLLEYIAALPQDIKENCTFDFFGSGPAEESFLRTLHNLDLKKIASFKGCVDTGKLPGILTGYDAGIAWVPRLLYDDAPSLKMVEYIAAGLLPIATNTTAHKRYAAQGLTVKYFSETPNSFANTIAECFEQGFSSAGREKNLEKVQAFDWDNVVRDHILPAFREAITGKQQASITLPARASFMSKKSRFKHLSKILFISPRPFGLMGTPGTYHLVDAYARFADVRVIANKVQREDVDIVYKAKNVKHLVEMDIKQGKAFHRTISIMQKFKPDVVVIGNSHRWYNWVRFLKNKYPKAKYVLDIKTPLITPGNKTLFTQIQHKGQESQHNLDLVMTRCQEDVDSWIPDYRVPVLEYPLGIKLEEYSPKHIDEEMIRCHRFVYIGSIHPLRKIDKLITYISELPEDLKRAVTFDFYGSGAAVTDFDQLVSRHNLHDAVFFKGCLNSTVLSTTLAGYDAGIAWVPHEKYEYAPSLKLVEYLASGLVPLAMDTVAHKRYSQKGFHIEFFAESANSFHNGIKKVCEEGFPNRLRTENLQRITNFDWEAIAEKDILPVLNTLAGSKTRQNLAIGNDVTSEAQPAFAENFKTRTTKENVIKLLVITPRPFGLMGTPGTYYLVDSYGLQMDVRIVANDTSHQNIDIVYHPKNVKGLSRIKFGTRRYLHEIQSIVKEFGPQIVVVGNFLKWYEIVEHLKENCPSVKYILDIKTPLIVDEGLYNLLELQQINQSNGCHLDLIMAYSQEAIASWIPDYSRQRLIYPLGIKYNQFLKPELSSGIIPCRRFVYIGSLHSLRKLDLLLRYIEALPDTIRKLLTVDFYGSGPETENLSSIIRECGLENTVFLRGCFDNHEIGGILAQYDAGLAWVPHKIYDNSPSLKLLEYMAAGLAPIATDTQAHKTYAHKGFKISFFADSADSFREIMENVVLHGITGQDRLHNRKLMRDYDWDDIASTYILPAFEKLIEKSPFKTAENTPSDKRVFQSTFMNKNSISQETMKNLHIWCHSFKIPEPKPVHDRSLRIAGILGQRLTDGLCHECTMLLLLPKNWKQVLKYGKPDILLVESTWFTASGHWYMAQSVPGDQREELDSMLKLAGKLSIPTVFWFTLDSQYHEHFVDFARRFDRVYCADPKGLELMGKDGVRAEILLPAVQPVIFNPIHNYNTISIQNTGIVYDGWYDLFKFPDLNTVISKFKELNLNIIESAAMMYEIQLQRLHDKSLIPFVRGTVDQQDLPAILKHASTYLSCTKTASTQTRRIWTSLEAAACRLPIAHLGFLEINDPRNAWVHCCKHEDEYLDYVKRLREDVLLRERQVHKAWRIAFKEHTLSKRLQTICSDLGIQFLWEEFPRATLVTGTMREHLLPKCFKQFEEQTYPNKELILIFNGDSRIIDRFKRKYTDNPNIVVTSMPQESTIGTILNFGAHKATGSYFFRVDDDDHYSPDYIFDSMLYLRAKRVDIFGKRASFFHFEGEPEIYLRKGALPPIKRFPARLLHQNDDFLISGCSFGADVSFLKKNGYPDFVQASADTALIEYIKENSPNASCLLIDNLNLVAERLADVSNHTWRIAADQIKDKATEVATSFEEVMG